METEEINQEQIEETAVKLSAEQALATLENDIVAYTNSLELAIKEKENYIVQLEIDKGMWTILEKEGSTARLNPSFKYETDPEWAVLQHKKQLYKIRQDRAMADGQVQQYEDAIENTKRALEESKEKLTRFGSNSE
jgi:hypothetical protein